ncbi:MAG: thiosulfate sulfurtransferase [Leptospiraceae bacterium]|nr:thiosulfate sulfurtransferase [Leptospiraceae bacterium]MCP5495204.1 thiosulfate sulfurtransferase [Leptospiraceae bacterium]
MSNWNILKPEIEPSDFIIDCRSQSNYESSTVKGAYYFPFIKKAFGSDAESQKKIYNPLKNILGLIENNNKSRVIVFDEGMGMFASRMVFFLRAIGFKETFLLAKRWPFNCELEAGSKIMEFESSEKAKALKGIVDKSFMEKNLTRLQIFDARTKEEYDGSIPRLSSPEEGTLCGRLPGAFLWDWRTLYESNGMILDKSKFLKRLAGFPFMPERTTIIYDYNGARSCLLALLLKDVGYQDIHTYQGSWFEWRKSNLPKQAVSIYGIKNQAAIAAPRVGGKDRKKV